MENSTARKTKYLNIFEGIFSKDKILYSRCFYFFGLLAWSIVILAFFSFFLYFLAEPTQPPEEVKVTNITDQSVTITWKTTKKTKGLVTFTQATTPRLLRPVSLLSLPSNNRAFDQFSGLSNLHSVTLTKLSGNTPYLYRISTGLHTYKIDLDSKILPPVVTALVLPNLATPNPLFGQVLENNGQAPAKNTLVYLSLVNQNNQTRQSSLLSAITNNSGFYIFDLSNLRTTDLKTLPIYLPETQVLIEVEAGENGTGQAFVLPGENKTVETITLK